MTIKNIKFLISIFLPFALSSCLVGGDANVEMSTTLLVPKILEVTPVVGATYSLDENLDFSVQFDRPIVVTGVPSIELTVGSSQKSASYFSGSGTTTLVFRYTVGSGDSDSNGISVNEKISLNGGSLLSQTSVAADLNFVRPDTSAVNVDGVLPVLVSITPPTNQNYTSTTTAEIEFTLVFDDILTVIGSPQLTLTIGSNTRKASYVSGSGTTSLLFRYTVVAADMDMDGISMATDLDFNGSSIKDANGNSIAASLSALDLSGVSITFPGIGLWLDINDASTVQDAQGDKPGDVAFDNIVAALADKSGLGNNATQSTSGKEPSYILNAINTNMPVMRFDGVNDFLTTPFNVNINNVIFTVFAHDHTGAAAPRGPVWQTQKDVAGSGFFPRYSDNKQYVATTTGAWISQVSTFVRNQFYYTTVIADNAGGSTELYEGGTPNQAGGGTQPAGSNFQIGKRTTDIFRGDVVEIIIFNRVLDATASGEIDQIEAYLSNKWGL